MKNSWLCSNYNEIIKVSLPLKWKNAWLKILTYTEILHEKTRKTSSKILKVDHDSKIFGWWAFFGLERINSIILEGISKKRKKGDLIVGGRKILFWEQQIFAVSEEYLKSGWQTWATTRSLKAVRHVCHFAAFFCKDFFKFLLFELHSIFNYFNSHRVYKKLKF